MAGSVNKVIIDLYRSGKSIPDVSHVVGKSRSAVRYHLAKADVLRTKAEGIRLVSEKLGSGMRGKKRTFSPAHREAMSASALSRADKFAAGISQKPNGYIEITRGENKGRSVHVTTMENRIGRRINHDEVVHHIDGDRANNSIDNLALMTRAAHMRLHRREQKLSKGVK
jgi:HNH endonuclease